MLVNDNAIREIARLAPTLDTSASYHWNGHEAEGREYELAKDPANFWICVDFGLGPGK